MRALFTKLSISLLILLACTFAFKTATAQLKIGDHPTTIQKSSILELESDRQGLLLTRISDTSIINGFTPPDGMIIYLNTDNSLRLRSNGYWKKIADLSEAAANWSLTGNNGTDSAANFLGTIDGKPLTLKTNGQARLIVGSNGNIGIGTTTPTATLDVNGTVKLENLANGTNELEVLVIQNDGSVVKRSMSSSAFENAIKAINGLQYQTLSLTAAATDTVNNVTVQNRTSDSTIAIYLPVQDGSSASKPYGFLTYGDWQKIHSGLQEITIGAVASTSNANGASIVTTDSLRTIILHPADATNPGIVTAGAQTFGGNKTFQDSVTVNGRLTLNSVAANTTSDSVLVYNNGNIERRVVSPSAFGNAIRSINSNRDTAQGITFHNSGTDLTVSTNGTDSIFLNVPDAAAGSRGVVTTTAQTFGGNKTFQDSVAAAKAVLVGGAGNANSTMQVNGSVSMAIISKNGDYTATVNDNTILANTTGGAITITLPTATTIAGRIYTIKKVGNGGINNKLTISTSGGALIDGDNVGYTIYNDWTFVTLQTDGTDWFVIKR